MPIINMLEAKSNLSRLVEAVESGAEAEIIMDPAKPPMKSKGGGGGSSPSPERAGPAVGAADATSEGAPA